MSTVTKSKMIACASDTYDKTGVLLGASYKLFNRHKNVCGFSTNAAFTYHLLSLHERYCDNYHKHVLDYSEKTDSDTEPNVPEANDVALLYCEETLSDHDISQSPRDTMNADVKHALEDMDQQTTDVEHPLESIDQIRDVKHPLECIHKIKVETFTEDVESSAVNDDTVQAARNDTIEVLEDNCSVVMLQYDVLQGAFTTCDQSSECNVDTASKDGVIDLTANSCRSYRGVASHGHPRSRRKLLVCEICNKQFKRKLKLLNHKRSHTESLVCEICNKQFKRKMNLLTHKRAHAEGKLGSSQYKKYKCSFCDAEFKHKPTCVSHECIHLGKKRYQCQFCSKGYNCRKSYISHERSHSNTNSYVCAYCGTMFLDSDSLAAHEHISHVETELFTCKCCGENFNSKESLKSHEFLRRVAKVDDKLSCPICKKAFASFGNMRRHLQMVHSGQKSFKCKHCHKSFGSNDFRNRHELSHASVRVKPFQCIYCIKSFSQKNALKTHVLTHTGEKPFVCIYCGMTFAHVNSLRKHEQKH